MKSVKKFSFASILLSLILVFSVANVAHSIVVNATIHVTTTEMTYDSGKSEVFVNVLVPYVNEAGMQVTIMSHSVSVISDITNAIIANITLSDEPGGIAYDSGRNELFVSDQNSGTVSVISDLNNTVVATIPLNGSRPTGIMYDSGMGEVFVEDRYSGLISVISDSNNSVVSTLLLGNNPPPAHLTYDSGKGEIPNIR